MMPFFAESTILEMRKQPESLIPKCGLCKLHKHCESPKMKVFGKGKRKILIVGEVPGENEDKKNRPFCGASGKHLKNCLGDVGIDMDEDCWLTNSLICRPEKNRTPTIDEIGYCRPNLTQTIKTLKPSVVLTLGHAALQSILMGVWKEKVGPMGRWAGFNIPSRDINAWIIPTYHPSHVLREIDKQKGGTALPVVWSKHLESALKKSKKGHPWKKIPDVKKKIECILDSDEAAKIIKYFIRKGGPCAFDYETNMLKPDDPKAFILIASICWRGKRTIAFPMEGRKLIKVFKEFLTSDIPKIAHNLKFEDRWSNRIFGVVVKNWAWDSMVNAHLIDNRPWICNLAFQTYTNFGAGDWSAHISPMLGGTRSYDTNRIKEIELGQLLLYNGLDSYWTYKLAAKQAKQFKMRIK
jgi:DNA polymerase